jgi:type I restriction enzyme R subunit
VAGDATLGLALKIDAAVKAARPDGWRGVQTKENVIKAALLPLMGNNVPEVERIFAIIKQQAEY